MTNLYVEQNAPLHEYWLWLRMRADDGKRVTYLIERETLVALDGPCFTDIGAAHDRHARRIESAARHRFLGAQHGDAIVLTLDDLDAA